MSPPQQVELRAVRADAPEAAALIAAYLAELRVMLGEFDVRRSTSAEVGEMLPPLGVFLVLYDRAAAVACGGLKTHTRGVGEIKRMFVAPEARRRGHARTLLRALEAHARTLGHARLLLDTAAPLKAASALYLAEGYREVPPYNDNPYAAHWFEKSLENSKPDI